MDRDEAKRRADAGLPIESPRELVHALTAVSRRLRMESPEWYLVNRAIREAMTLADTQERGAAALEKSTKGAE